MTFAGGGRARSRQVGHRRASDGIGGEAEKYFTLIFDACKLSSAVSKPISFRPLLAYGPNLNSTLNTEDAWHQIGLALAHMSATF